MSIVSLNILKSYFLTGKKPTQAQFENLIDTLSSVITFKQTIPAAQFRTLFSSPITLLPAPGLNKYYVPIQNSIGFRKKAGTIVYDFAGGQTTIGYTSDGSNSIISFLDSGVNTTSEFSQLQGITTNSTNNFLNNGIFLLNTAQDATQGDGDVIISFQYQILDLN